MLRKRTTCCQTLLPTLFSVSHICTKHQHFYTYMYTCVQSTSTFIYACMHVYKALALLYMCIYTCLQSISTFVHTCTYVDKAPAFSYLHRIRIHENKTKQTSLTTENNVGGKHAYEIFFQVFCLLEMGINSQYSLSVLSI